MRIKQDIWVEKLIFPDIIILLARRVFSDISVHYDENNISCLARRFLSIFKRQRLARIFYPAGLRFNLLDADGRALNYQYQKDLDLCSRSFCENYLADQSEWFQKMTQAYIAGQIDYRLRFITMVQAKISKRTQGQQAIFIVRHPLNYLIIQYYQGQGVNIQQSLSIAVYKQQIIQLFYWLGACVLSLLVPDKRSHNIKEIRPAIWVEYERRQFESKRKNSTFFWREHIKKKDYDLIYYLDRADTPVREDSQRITAAAYKWIDFNRLYCLARLNLKQIGKILLKLVKFNTKLPLWFYCFDCKFFMCYRLYSSAYRRFKVKILIQHQELSWMQGIQAKAIEAAGGIMIGFHWSHFPFYREVARLTPHHVYFVWGRATREWLQKTGNTCRYILPSGLCLLPDDQKPEEFNNLSNDLKFVLAVFDTGAEYNIITSPENFSQFYELLINLLEENQDWGAIVKSKDYDRVNLPLKDELMAKIEDFIAQKRIVFLETHVSPLTAASHADLSVCLNLNTAGIASAIQGYRAVHWDCCGWSKHFFYKDACQTFLYPLLDEFKEAIIKAGRGDRSIGDFSAFRQEFNYFEDTQAPQRVGKFIDYFMEEIAGNKDVDDALKKTVNNYLQDNRVSESFYEYSNCWEDE